MAVFLPQYTAVFVSLQSLIVDSCKKKEKPLTVQERKQLFLEKLDKRMSTSEAMKVSEGTVHMSALHATLIHELAC